MKSMLQTIKRFWWLVLLAVGVPAAWGYALIGPVGNGGDSWQTQALGYNPQRTIDQASTGPKNIGEEYRQNRGVIYYAYDATFLGFFGSDSNGVEPVDGAFAIMNAAFTNNPTGMKNGLDGYSPSLDEFPLNSQHVNYQALALGLTDMKSLTLWALVEQMGLAWPERYIWDLHDEYLDPGPPPGVCPDDEYYEVVMRNYPVQDSLPTQFQYSPYVNDTLYTFNIYYFCQANASYDWQFLAQSVPVDPFAEAWTSVAGNGEQLLSGGAYSSYGTFFTGITRDDAAGLRYLLSKNNVNWESPAPGASLLATNLGGYTFITSSNLSALLVASETNAPDTIPTLFPGVTVASSTTNWTVVYTPIIDSYYAIPIGSPYPSVPVLTLVTNGYTQTPMFVYSDTFAGILTKANLMNTPNLVLGNTNITLNYFTNTPARLVTVTIGVPIGAAYPASITTNTTSQSIILTNASGEYLPLPTAANQCGWDIIAVVATNVVATTNVIAEATNNVTSGSLATNSVGFVGTVSVVTYFTNHTFLAQPINCVSSVLTNGLYQGIERVQFVRANYDSYLGQLFQPITNEYTMTAVNNSQAEVQRFQRVVTQPDIVFAANDEPLTTTLPTYTAFSRGINFDTGAVLPNLAGPGTVSSPTTFTFNKAGNLYLNGSMASYGITTNSLIPYLGELNQSLYGVIWASFDASTNPPVVYPNGTSLQNLANQLLIQVTPAPGILPDGINGVAYTNTSFSATGGAFTPPYTWGLAAGSPVLPQGLSLSTTNSVGTLSGTPQNNPPGTFDFTIQLTDSVGRSVNWNYSMTIH